MNDWRLTGQEEYLFNVELKKINREEIKNKSDLWHEHCEFCMKTISNKYEQVVYSTKDEYRWICKKCFNALLKGIFHRNRLSYSHKTALI